MTFRQKARLSPKFFFSGKGRISRKFRELQSAALTSSVVAARFLSARFIWPSACVDHRLFCFVVYSASQLRILHVLVSRPSPSEQTTNCCPQAPNKPPFVRRGPQDTLGIFFTSAQSIKDKIWRDWENSFLDSSHLAKPSTQKLCDPFFYDKSFRYGPFGSIYLCSIRPFLYHVPRPGSRSSHGPFCLCLNRLPRLGSRSSHDPRIDSRSLFFLPLSSSTQDHHTSRLPLSS